jgi:hypothetical protein
LGGGGSGASARVSLASGMIWGNVSDETIVALIWGGAGRAIKIRVEEVSNDCSGWHTSREMDGPLRSATTITPIVGRVAIIITSAIAAASWRIVRRSIPSEVFTFYLLAVADRTIDVGCYIFRADVERVVLADLMAVGTEQEC